MQYISRHQPGSWATYERYTNGTFQTTLTNTWEEVLPARPDRLAISLSALGVFAAGAYLLFSFGEKVDRTCICKAFTFCGCGTLSFTITDHQFWLKDSLWVQTATPGLVATYHEAYIELPAGDTDCLHKRNLNGVKPIL